MLHWHVYYINHAFTTLRRDSRRRMHPFPPIECQFICCSRPLVLLLMLWCICLPIHAIWRAKSIPLRWILPIVVLLHIQLRLWPHIWWTLSMELSWSLMAMTRTWCSWTRIRGTLSIELSWSMMAIAWTWCWWTVEVSGGMWEVLWRWSMGVRWTTSPQRRIIVAGVRTRSTWTVQARVGLEWLRGGIGGPIGQRRRLLSWSSWAVTVAPVPSATPPWSLKMKTKIKGMRDIRIKLRGLEM